ncbi:MAG: MarP family serine protease [Nocardioides sp.]
MGRRCSVRSTGCSPSRPARCCAPSTTSSAPVSSRATWSRSPLERTVEVAPGPRRLLEDPDVQRAGQSVAKIRAVNACGQGVEGVGCVRPGRVMTNAHVVAGVRDPRVTIGEEVLDARVVLYDPDLDVAVLELDATSAAPLPFGFDARERQGVAILGYPQDGPFDVETARIRAEQRLRSPNIYGSSTVIREVYSVRGQVRPGNSGGPLVDSAGRVVGVVFAASVSDQQTGYALTAEQVRETAARGVAANDRVSTGACAD